MFLKILFYKLKIHFLSIILRDKINTKIGTTLFLILITIIFLIFYGFSRFFFLIFTDVPYFGPNLPYKILIFLFLVFFIILLLSGISVCLSTLYFSSDLSLLLSLPISHRSVLLIKYLETMIGNSGIFFLFGFPILLAYIHSFPIFWLSSLPFGFFLASIAYYFLLFFVIILFLSIPTSIGIIICLAVMRFLPAYRAKEILAFLAALLGGVFYLFYYFFRIRSFESFDYTSPFPFTFSTKYLWLKFIPGTWAANSLSFFSQGNMTNFLKDLTLLFLFSTILFLLTFVLAERVYYFGLVGSQVVYTKKKTVHLEKRKKFYPSISSPLVAIIVKDMKILGRDLRLLSQTLMPLIFIFAYFFMLPMISKTKEEGFPFFSTSWFVFLAIFLVFVISANFSFIAFGSERKSLWLILSSPLKPYQFLEAKLIYSLILTTILGGIILLVLFISFKMNILLFFATFLIMIFLIFGVLGLYLGLGIYFCNFSTDDPRRVFSPLGGIIILFLDIIYFILCVGILFLTKLGLNLALKTDLPNLFYSILLTGGTIFILFTLASGLASLYFGVKKLERMEWEK